MFFFLSSILCSVLNILSTRCVLSRSLLQISGNTVNSRRILMAIKNYKLVYENSRNNSSNTQPDAIGNRFSSFSKLLRIIVYYLNFKSLKLFQGILNVEELKIVHNKVLKLIQ